MGALLSKAESFGAIRAPGLLVVLADARAAGYGAGLGSVTAVMKASLKKDPSGKA